MTLAHQSDRACDCFLEERLLLGGHTGSSLGSPWLMQLGTGMLFLGTGRL